MKTLLELSEKRRQDIRLLLDHSIRLEPRFSRELVGNEAFPDAIGAMLREHGAPATCHVMAADDTLDGRDMPLSRALDAIVGAGDGAFVSCIPGRLGFYQYAERSASYLLSR